MGERALWGVFHKVMHPTQDGSFHYHDLLTSRKLHFQMPSHGGLGLQYINIGEHKYLIQKR